VRFPVTAVGPNAEAAPGARDRGDGRPLAERSAERPRVALKRRHELRSRRIRIRVHRRVVVRQPVRPVRREQRERIPALAAPALADTAALEHDVVVPGFREEAAEGKPSLAAADDDRVDRVHGREANATAVNGR
jgi:hypothetical protein